MTVGMVHSNLKPAKAAPGTTARLKCSTSVSRKRSARVGGPDHGHGSAALRFAALETRSGGWT